MRTLMLVLLFCGMCDIVLGQDIIGIKKAPISAPPFNTTPRRHTSTGRGGGRIRGKEDTVGANEGISHPHRLQDNDFVINNASALVRPPNSRDLDEEGQIPSTPPEGDNVLDRAVQLLQRLNDRITALHALDEQQLRRLETLEYRLTKIEVQAQEKNEGIKSELREVSQRVRQLDWQNSKMEAMIEAIKLDTNGLKQGQDHIRGVQAGTGEYMANLSGQLLTKQYFTNVMMDFKHETTLPAQAIPQALIASMTNHHQQDEPYEEPLPHDCWDVRKQGHNASGIYRIKPVLSTVPFFVYCQMETKGGGWTVVQNRYEGTVNFYREWQDYKHGFGNIGGEFWLGLEKIHTLTNHKVCELLIELQDFSLENSYAYYTAFAVGTEIEGYPISFLGSYEGDAGDSLIYHAGMKFSTYDMDHDNWHDGNCAESHTGAWWYNGCDTSNLNGRYLNGDLPETFEYKGMYWYDWHGPSYSLMKSRISVRPSNHSHSYLKLNDNKQINKTTKGHGKKIHTVHPLHLQNTTEPTGHKPTVKEVQRQNEGLEDSPPVDEHNQREVHESEYPDPIHPYDHDYFAE
ncbi:hypothetical protein C0J52_07086 [Blattella germanica]|nr:hypothetical protein C0J52_07086 [Blattella germanica]